jgi:AraC family transcriptional regulator
MASNRLAMLKTRITEEFAIELTSVERLLVRTPLFALGEFRCPENHPQFRHGGPQSCAYVAFPRTPVKITPHRGRAEICTPALASFYNIGDTYDRCSVGQGGDNCDWIAVSQELVRELVGPVSGDGADPAFAGCFAPVDSRAFLAQKRIFNQATRCHSVSVLECEESVVALLEYVVSAAMIHWHSDSVATRSSTVATRSRRVRIVDDVKHLIAVSFREDLSLSELADKVHCSPGYLARSFRAVTDTTLHDYRNQLRLRAAMPLLPEFRNNISVLALDLGFASHSHFSEAFRRQFGLTPSTYVGNPGAEPSLFGLQGEAAWPIAEGA